MPQLRIYHQGRYMYYRPGRTAVHFLPPLNPHDDAKKSVAMGTVASEVPNSRGGSENGDRFRRSREFKKVIQHVSNSLTKENVDDMKFLAKEHIYPSHLLDRISNGREFIALLEQKKFLTENSMHFLQTLLYYVARHDLYERLFRFRYGVQGNYRAKGVKIEEKYNLTQQSGEILRLPVEVKSFRDELHPRSRFKDADIPSMRHKLMALSRRFDETRNRRILHNSFQRSRGTATDATAAADDVISIYTKAAFQKQKHDQVNIGSVSEDKAVSTEVSTTENNPLKKAADVKLKKLRRRLNVNLVKQYNPRARATLVHNTRQLSRNSKNSPFVKKVGVSNGFVRADDEDDLTVKPILPSL